MTDKPQPQWQGVTLYLVTYVGGFWACDDDFTAVAHEFGGCLPDWVPHVWEVQIGQAPVDVTDAARKLVGAA